MKLDLILAGVPKGADYWGPEEDSNYFASYYTGPKNYNDRFLVEIRKNKDGIFSYFTLLKYNTFDEESRSGGFFAISVRMDAICKRVISFYNFLHLVYNKYVVGSILKEDSAGVRFLTSSFKIKDAEIRTIQESVIKYIQISFTGADFSTLDNNFSLERVQEPLLINVADAKWNLVSQILQKRSSFYISDSPETIREKTQRELAEKKLDSIVNAKNEEIALLKDDVKTYQQQLEDAIRYHEQYLAQSNEALANAEKNNKRVRELESELSIYKKKTDFSIATAEIRKPLLQLASYVNHDTEESNRVVDEIYSIRKLLISLLVISSSVLILIGLVILLLYRK